VDGGRSLCPEFGILELHGMVQIQSKMVQSLGLRIKAVDDIPQSLSTSQLCEGHGNELLATAEMLYFLIAVVLPDL
jgi:hypothetical protein